MCTNTKNDYTVREELADRKLGVNSDHIAISKANGTSEKEHTTFWVIFVGDALWQGVNHLTSWAGRALQRLLYLQKSFQKAIN